MITFTPHVPRSSQALKESVSKYNRTSTWWYGWDVSDIVEAKGHIVIPVTGRYAADERAARARLREMFGVQRLTNVVVFAYTPPTKELS